MSLLRRHFHGIQLRLQTRHRCVEARNLDVCAPCVRHCLGDVFGPSSPRTHVAESCRCPSHRTGELCRLPLSMRTPACVQPLGSGTVQRRAAVACRVVFSFAECARSLVAGRGTSVSDGSSFGRVLGAQPMLLEIAQTEETGITRRQERTMIKGRPPFCQLQRSMHCGASACCAPKT